MADLFTFEALSALAALTALEIVLGIDNIVFIAILSGKLPEHKRAKARRAGLAAAMLMRIALLLAINWIMTLERTLFSIGWLGEERGAFTGKELILLLGGLFLIAKATQEIHNKLEVPDRTVHALPKAAASMGGVIAHIMVMDMVFSLDSVITAVGMVPQRDVERWVPLTIMITAVVIAIVVMMVFAGPVSRFVERHPSVKMLALSFLLLIGVMLTAEAFDAHIPKGYIYFAMSFSLFVELLNLRLRKVSQPVHLHSNAPE